MKRREFIIFSAISSLALNLKANNQQNHKEEFSTIHEVYEIVYPKTTTMPSASEFGATKYLIQNINHSSFSKEDKTYLLEGARVFKSQFPEFFTANIKQKNQIIKDITFSEYGQGWVELLVYYGFEALLGDPIYGGNKNKIGWNSLNHKAGNPRPKQIYGGLYERV